uniref:Feruloyl esterase n=1 Tax=Talaromyces piceae TaxID=153982 RepID=A0A2D2AGX3_9EURO|nr:feruloyl esterase [Talaromyces piceae]
MRYSSLLLILSGVVQGVPIWSQEGKTPVAHADYQDIVRYAGYPRLSNGDCSTVPSTGATSLQFFNITSTDTQAVLWKLPSEKSILVAIPGTASTTDAITDIDFFFTQYTSPGVDCQGGCLVHKGFLGAWNSLAEQLIPALESALEENPDYKTIITGHSLGGAIAQLAFGSLSDTTYKVAGAYTYGQPRVGNEAYADYIDSLAGASSSEAGIFHRVTHYNGNTRLVLPPTENVMLILKPDGVPLLPPRIFGFTHSLTEYWESAETADESTTYRCNGRESLDCNDSAGGFAINDAHGSYAGFDLTCE